MPSTMYCEKAQSVFVSRCDSGKSTIQLPRPTGLLQLVLHVVRQKPLCGQKVTDNVRITAVENDIVKVVLLNDVPEDSVHRHVLLLVRHEDMGVATLPTTRANTFCHMKCFFHFILVQIIGELGANTFVCYSRIRIYQVVKEAYLKVYT